MVFVELMTDFVQKIKQLNLIKIFGLDLVLFLQ